MSILRNTPMKTLLNKRNVVESAYNILFIAHFQCTLRFNALTAFMTPFDSEHQKEAIQKTEMLSM